MSDLANMTSEELTQSAEAIRDKMEFYIRELEAGADEDDKERVKRLHALINVLAKSLAQIRVYQINQESNELKKLPLV